MAAPQSPVPSPQPPYAELHAHSCWSLREGASGTDEMVDRALRLRYPALAITDHDNLYGAMEFAQAASERGLKPITGCEITLASALPLSTPMERGPGGEVPRPTHLTLLAMDVDGYRNICRLLSRAYKTYGKDTPMVEKAWLFEHHEGLIVLSGCRNSELSLLFTSDSRFDSSSLQPLASSPSNLSPQSSVLAEEIASEYRATFGDRFYIELQHHDVFGDSARVAALAEFAERMGIEVVATNNAHYHARYRHRVNDVLVAIQHRLTLDSSHEVRRPNSEFFLKHPAEMAARFERYPRAISNTVAIAERCTFDLTKDLPYRLPDHPVPEGATLDSHLQGICEPVFRRKYGAEPDEIRADARSRLDRELELIAKHGLAGFFLVYWELLQLCNEVAFELHGRDKNLAPDERPVARGRGSSVSSIVCYLIGLSHIDPVKNNLYLERFLNEELHSLPDIDLDFPRDIRDELLQRVYNRFGEEHAAIVAAFPTYRFKNSVLDVGKALGLPIPVLAKLNKLGDHFANADEVAREMSYVPELKGLVGAPLWKDLVDICSQIAGFPRHIGQHVGGVVISSEKLSSVVPVEPARMEGRYVCQWDKDSVDDARFVKIDFLALGMLSAVDDCLDIVEEVHGQRLDLGRIPHDSPEIYASIQAGDTMGVFQIESRAQIQTLPFTRPETLDDLAVQVAIIRPGPIVAGTFHPYMEFRKMIAAGKPVDIDYGHPQLGPLLKDVLGETVGHVLYQDQVLQIACAVAGFTPGQADKLRRAMSRKRSTEAMQALAEEFYAGAAAQGVCREAATVAWDKMAAFAAFGFPKSHAVAFALLAYESTWLRYHFPTAYYCSLFNAQPMGFYSLEVLTGDANRHGIQVLAPSINISKAMSWPELGDVRLGLESVKGIGGGWRERGMGRKERRAYRGYGAGDDSRFTIHDSRFDSDQSDNRQSTIDNRQSVSSLLPPPSSLSVAERLVFERESHGPYRSLYDLMTRARLTRDQATALIEAGALDDFALERRELLWQLGLMVDSRFMIHDSRFEPGAAGLASSPQPLASRSSLLPTPSSLPRAYQPPLPLPTAQDMADLPALSEWEELAWDYERLGTTDKKHPMALVRPLLHEGVITTRHLGGPMNPNRLPQDATVEIAGMIVTRQRPATASGVMFMLLEDEFGLANIVVYTQLQERQRELVRATPFVIIKGKVDNVKSGFPNIIATSYRPCPLPGRIEAPNAHNFG